MKVTMQEIADRCHTSPATVSRVLNQTDYPVSEDLRNLIISTAIDMRYKAPVMQKFQNHIAKRSVTVIVPNLVNPYYSELVEGLEKASRSYYFHPILLSSDNSPELEKELLTESLHSLTTGIIISCINSSETLQPLLQDNQNIPVVLFDQTSLKEENVRSVNYNFRQAGRIISQYLLETGHQHLAFVTPSFDRTSRKLLRMGIQDELRRAKSDVSLQTITFASQDLRAEPDQYTLNYQNLQMIGSRLVSQILQLPERPDALIAVNDLLAIALLNELKNQGIQVPRDMSLVGNDGLWISAMVSPGITSIRQDSHKIAQAAVELLNRSLIDQAPVDPIWIEPELILRGSVQNRKKK